MHLNIVVRAADPAAAAEALGALGIHLEAPNRPNPDSWHAWGGSTLVIERCGDGEEPSVALAFADLPERLRAAGLRAGPHAEDDPSPHVLDAGDLAIPLLDHAGPVARPSGDQGLLPHATMILEDARAELARAFRRAGARDPRLAGPQIMSRGARDAVTGHFDPVFTIIFDGATAKGIAAIGAVLDRHRGPGVRLEVVAAETIEADLLARIDRLAWDLSL